MIEICQQCKKNFHPRLNILGQPINNFCSLPCRNLNALTIKDNEK